MEIHAASSFISCFFQQNLFMFLHVSIVCSLLSPSSSLLFGCTASFLSSLVYRYLDCFQFGTIINKAHTRVTLLECWSELPTQGLAGQHQLVTPPGKLLLLVVFSSLLPPRTVLICRSLADFSRRVRTWRAHSGINTPQFPLEHG